MDENFGLSSSKGNIFVFSPKGESRFAQAANRPLPEERGFMATFDKKSHRGLIPKPLAKLQCIR